MIQANAGAARTYIGAGTSNFDGTFTSLTGKPNTLAGYGITDGITAAAVAAGYQPLDTDLTGWAAKVPYAGIFTITTGKTISVTNTLTLSGTDASTLNIGGGGTLGTAAYTAASAYQVADADLTTYAGVTPTTVGLNFRDQANPTAIRFPKITAGNDVVAEDAATFRASIGAGTSSFDGAFGSLTGKPITLAGYGITGTLAEFNTALTGADFATGGGTATGTNTGDQTLVGLGGEPALGHPSTNGYVLSSTTAGARSWIAGAGGGSGDVVGPASATDNAIARFDTTTGKLIQNALSTVDDTGNIIGPGAGFTGFFLDSRGVGIKLGGYADNILFSTGSGGGSSNLIR